MVCGCVCDGMMCVCDVCDGCVCDVCDGCVCDVCDGCVCDGMMRICDVCDGCVCDAHITIHKDVHVHVHEGGKIHASIRWHIIMWCGGSLTYFCRKVLLSPPASCLSFSSLSIFWR